MTQSINNFQAAWTDKNNILNPTPNIIFGSLINKMKNILFYLPNTLVALCLNPRRESTKRMDSKYGDVKFISKEIYTPDNAKLVVDTHHSEWFSKKFNNQKKTVILFNPLGCNSNIFRGKIVAEFIDNNFNVVCFDYRGFSKTRRAQDLVIDGDSVYQYVVTELKVDPKKIHFFGYSLGGAVASQVKALHPECTGKIATDRSFASIYLLISENICISRFGKIIKAITSLFTKIFIAYPIYLTGCELDTKKAFEKINSKKLTFYHKNDSLVPFDANIANYNKNRLVYDQKEGGHFSPMTDLDINKIPAEKQLINFFNKA
jgi:hypothetical protein